MIGRLLRQKLEISTTIESANPLVEQAAWFEGTTARGVFDFAEDTDGGTRYWAVWGPGWSGKPVFEYRNWQILECRYVVPPQAGTLQLAGGAEQLANRAVVTYLTSRNVPASCFVTGGVQELDAAGITRTIIVDASGQGPLSKASAIQFGRDALARQDIVKLSGTAEVTGPVWDRYHGRWIEPWEMRAGWPAAFGGGEVRTRGQAAEASTELNSKAVWRVTATSFTASDGVCRLTLDGGGRTAFRRARRMPPKNRGGAQGGFVGVGKVGRYVQY